jgi:hypothetical protein
VLLSGIDLDSRVSAAARGTSMTATTLARAGRIVTVHAAALAQAAAQSIGFAGAPPSWSCPAVEITGVEAARLWVGMTAPARPLPGSIAIIASTKILLSSSRIMPGLQIVRGIIYTHPNNHLDTNQRV